MHTGYACKLCEWERVFHRDVYEDISGTLYEHALTHDPNLTVNGFYIWHFFEQFEAHISGTLA